MSRVSLIEKLKAKKNTKPAFEFDYDALWAPPILSIFTPQDIDELRSIATNIRYSNNISKKYELIDTVMRRRGFRKAHSGTNRVVYNFLESTAFVAKVAIDKVGMRDSPAEYKNQEYFKPFCCKIFEVDPSGVIAFVERVNPISSLEEFMSVADDIFNMMITKIIGKYVVDDLGTRTYMNFGIRQNSNGYAFGPVILDFPYVYEIDGAKLYCQHTAIDNITGMKIPCGGEIDYKPGFNGLYCTRCGRTYKAMDLAKEIPDIKFDFSTCEDPNIKKIEYKMRAVIEDNGKLIMDSGRSSKCYVSREEYESMFNTDILPDTVEVIKTTREKYRSSKQNKAIHYSALQKQYYDEINEYIDGDYNDDYSDDEFVVDKTVAVDVINNNVIHQTDNIIDNTSHGITNDDFDNLDPDQYMVLDVVETIDELERVTFPEMHDDNKEVIPEVTINNDGVYESSVKIIDESDIPAETSSVSSTSIPVYEEIIEATPVFSDDEVQKMVEANAARNKEDVGPKESTVLDKEADLEGTNPFHRPYPTIGALAEESVKTEPNEEPSNPIDANIATTDNDATPFVDYVKTIKTTLDNHIKAEEKTPAISNVEVSSDIIEEQEESVGDPSKLDIEFKNYRVEDNTMIVSLKVINSTNDPISFDSSVVHIADLDEDSLIQYPTSDKDGVSIRPGYFADIEVKFVDPALREDSYIKAGNQFINIYNNDEDDLVDDDDDDDEYDSAKIAEEEYDAMYDQLMIQNAKHYKLKKYSMDEL